MTEDDKTLPKTPLEDAKWGRSTVVMFERQIAFLDRFAIDIKERTGHIVTPAEIVRGLVDALIWSGADTTVIAAMYGTDQDEEPVVAEVTSPQANLRSSADVLRDVLTAMLSE